MTIRVMTPEALQELCETGQSLLMETKYVEAERVLAGAEHEAWTRRDWETLARLYMPLQEARRQRRQRCAEGTVVLDLIAQGPGDRVDGLHAVENFPHGQLLVAGWGSIQPALEVRKQQAAHGLYVETFLGAVFPVNGRRAVVLVPADETDLPDPVDRSIEALLELIPPHSVVVHEAALPKGSRRGDTQTFAETMALWERLHQPFLAAADHQPDPILRIEAYRRTIRVDYACEFAHQRLSNVAAGLARDARDAGR